MKYVLLDHQSKGAAYAEALRGTHERVHWEPGQTAPEVDFVLTDTDIRRRRGQLEQLRDAGARWFFVYPHTARPNLVNDIEPAWEHTTAHFVTTRAQREIMLRYGYPHPIHPVGWSLCEQRPFQHRSYLRNVLFAPIHHRCAEVDKLVNRDAFERLSNLAALGHFHLTVRHYMGIDTTGIEPQTHEHVHFVRADDQRPAHEDIDQADVVVAHQTFMYLAVARGVPAVGFGTWVPSHIIPGKEVIYAPRWHEYAGDMAYPLDIAFGDPLDVLWNAIEGNRRLERWRRDMIGEPFDRGILLDALESELK